SHADRAIELDGMSPVVLGLAGCALCDAGQELRGKTILERALSLDDGNPQALAALGTQLLREGELDRGIECLLDAIKIVPKDNTLAVWGSVLALGLLRRGDMDGALQEARKAVAADDKTHLSRVALAAIHAARGEHAQAKDAWADSRRVTPDLDEAQVAAVIGRKAAAEVVRLAGD
ncbi:MAG: tetratricopeptide repeat protein, partial [Boseongicola sp.]